MNKTSRIERDAASEQEVRALIHKWIGASKKLDIPTIMKTYMPGVVAFDAISQLQFKGVEAYEKHWEMCAHYMKDAPGPMTFEPDQLEVVAKGDIAFAHYIILCGPTKEQSSWMRGTVCCVKADGEWRIAHEHYSSPFDPESGKAIFDAKP